MGFLKRFVFAENIDKSSALKILSFELLNHFSLV